MKLFKTCVLVFAGLFSINQQTEAQSFNPCTGYNNVYPVASSNAMLRPETNSSYAISNITSPFGTADLYLTGWSGRTGFGEGFSWRFTAPGVPSTIFGQATVAYPNCRDIEVGLVDGPTGVQQILVAYYRAGAGHMLDVYNVNPFVSFAYSMPLSSSSVYGRISMDCHLTYGVAIVWENPATASIEAIGGASGSWGPVVTIPGSWSGIANTAPDVAFSHSSGPLNVHIVTFTPGINELTESVIPWPDLVGGFTGSYVVEDINPVVPPIVDVRPVIDCPDHYGVENWAYSYTLDNDQIEVRLIDYNTSGVPLTRIVNNGSLGNIPTVGTYRNIMPCLAHDFDPAQIYVAWYVTNGSYNAYAGFRITEDGSTLLSAPDYCQLPASSTTSAYPLVPGIAFSKMTDLNPMYAFAAYYDMVGNGYQMHNAYFPWGTFKGRTSPLMTYHPECGTEQGRTLTTLLPKVKVSPSPFTDVVTAAFTTEKAGLAVLQLIDITGKIVDRTTAQVEKGTSSLATTSQKNLAAGMYLLDISVDGKRIGQQKIMKQ